jgi:Cu2+-containing amine oxidase
LLMPDGFFERNPGIEPPRGSTPDAAKQ